MKSINQQCNELVDLATKIQACVDRKGNVIPCRADDFFIFIERARNLVGVVNKPGRA